MQTIAHPRSGATVLGVRLTPGAKIEKGDLYDANGGEWCPADLLAGSKVPAGNHVIWVRPDRVLSENARILLGYLCLQPWGEESCIGERNASFYVIPSPTFNWDGRFDIEAKRVQHPECLQELLDRGYLSFGEHTATNVTSDHSTVWGNHQNRIHVLTEEGKRKGKEILNN